MRILYWSELFRPAIGGVEVAAVPFLKMLVSRGHEVLVVAGQGPDGLPPRIVFEGLPVHRFPFHDSLLSRSPARIVALCREVASEKRSFAPDLLHLTTSQPSLFFHDRTRGEPRRRGREATPLAAYSPRRRLPSVMTLCEPLPDDLGRSPLLTRVLRSVSWVAAVSESVLGDLRAALPELATRSSVVHYGLPAPGPVLADTPAEPLLVAAGRLVPEKGFDLLLHALAMLRETRPGLRLVLLGDGRERERLAELARSLALTNAVELRGWTPPEAVAAEMARATLVVVPSLWKEPFGLVALQAAQVGRPVVASRRGGLVEIVRDGETGLFFAPGDAADLAEKIERILSDQNGARRMAEAARVRSLDFTVEAQVDAYEEIYRRIVSERAGG